MVRVFIAVDLPAEVREGIVRVQKALARSDARLTFVAPDNIHITLKFIGEISPAVLDQVKDALHLLSCDPFTIAFDRVSGSNPRRPRVIWAEGKDQGESAILHHRIEEVLSPLGIKKENRPFTPHATIARVKRFDPDLISIIESVATTTFGSVVVDHCTLKKSTLTPKGPVYEDIMEVPF